MRFPNRRVLTAACLLVAAALLPSAARAVGPDNPEITAPTSAAALYDGYAGPFVVRFDAAPKAWYAYSVIADPDGAATLVRGPVAYDGTGGASGDHQFKVAPLGPGHYRFAISDKATGTHQDSVDFTVRSGSAPRCSLVVPAKVRVNAGKEAVRGRLSSTCAALRTATADWKVTRGDRTFDYFRFDGNASDTWSLYDDDPVGAYTIEPLSARSSDFTDVPQNRPTVVARRDSRLALGGSRSGSAITLRTSLTVYSASTNAFRAWAGKYVAVSYRTCSTCGWHHLRTLTTDAHGHASYRLTASKAREYRAAVSGTSVAWAPWSAYTRI